MKTNRTSFNAIAAIIALVGLIAVSCQSPRVATGETDDLYFNSKDRMQVRYASEVATASNKTGNNGSLNYYSQSESGGVELQPEGTASRQAQEAADYYNPTYQMSAPMVDGTNRRTSSGGDTYITHNHYDSWSRNAFPGWGFQPVLGVPIFSPWGWGYNPWFGPRYRLWGRPGWNISIGFGWGVGMGWGMPIGWGYDPFWGPGIGMGWGMGMGMGWGYDPFWGPGMGWGWGGYDPFFNPYYRPGWGWGGNGMQPGNPSNPINPNRNPVVVGPRGRTGSNNVTSVSSVGPNSTGRMPSRQQLTSNGGGQSGSDAGIGSGRIPATGRPPSRSEVNTSNYSFNETTAPTRGNRESLGGGETISPIGGRQSTSPAVPKQYESGTTPSTYTNTRPGGRETAVPSSPSSPRRTDDRSGLSNSPAPSRDNNGSTNYYQRERSQMRNADVFTSPTRDSRSSGNWVSSPSNSGGNFSTPSRGSYSPSAPSRSTFSTPSPSPSPRISSPAPSSGGSRSNFGGGGSNSGGGGGSRTPSRPR